MRNLISLVIIVLFISSIAIADMMPVNFVDMDDEEERDNLMQSNSVIAEVLVRPGSDSVWYLHELFVNDMTSVNTGDVAEWQNPGSHPFVMTYDESGTLSVSITSGGVTTTASNTPDNWFNEILFSLEDNSGLWNQPLSLTGNSANGIGFRDMSASDENGYPWDGIRIQFPNNHEGEMYPFVVMGSLNLDSQIGFDGNSFRIEAKLIQNSTVPEPMTMSFLIFGLGVLGLRRYFTS